MGIAENAITRRKYITAAEGITWSRFSSAPRKAKQISTIDCITGKITLGLPCLQEQEKISQIPIWNTSSNASVRDQ